MIEKSCKKSLEEFELNVNDIEEKVDIVEKKVLELNSKLKNYLNILEKVYINLDYSEKLPDLDIDEINEYLLSENEILNFIINLKNESLEILSENTILEKIDYEKILKYFDSKKRELAIIEDVVDESIYRLDEVTSYLDEILNLDIKDYSKLSKLQKYDLNNAVLISKIFYKIISKKYDNSTIVSQFERISDYIELSLISIERSSIMADELMNDLDTFISKLD